MRSAQFVDDCSSHLCIQSMPHSSAAYPSCTFTLLPFLQDQVAVQKVKCNSCENRRDDRKSMRNQSSEDMSKQYGLVHGYDRWYKQCLI